MFILDGSMKTMESTWNGPPGQLVRKVGKMKICFRPDTLLRLENSLQRVRKVEDLFKLVDAMGGALARAKSNYRNIMELPEAERGTNENLNKMWALNKWKARLHQFLGEFLRDHLLKVLKNKLSNYLPKMLYVDVPYLCLSRYCCFKFV